MDLTQVKEALPAEERAVRDDSDAGPQTQSDVALAEDEPRDIMQWATLILNTADPEKKMALTQRAADLWNAKLLSHTVACPPPDMPARDEGLNVVAPKDMKLGKGGTLASRIGIIHSLANIEQWAIDLGWDIIARFGTCTFGPENTPLPRDFFTDFVTVAEDEARHYGVLARRLTQLGSEFGKLPVHFGLWQSASDTNVHLMARLAIVHMVHEARGLDVTPNTIKKFSNNGDEETAALLQTIYEEEITHVTAGVKWFKHVANLEYRGEEAIKIFHGYVDKYFLGYLKPPFNEQARSQAGFTPEWYEPMVKKES